MSKTVGTVGDKYLIEPFCLITPNASSVAAAKLVLDGAVVEKTKNALYFDSAPNSWAARNRTCIAVIGGHRFYA